MMIDWWNFRQSGHNKKERTKKEVTESVGGTKRDDPSNRLLILTDQLFWGWGLVEYGIGAVRYWKNFLWKIILNSLSPGEAF